MDAADQRNPVCIAQSAVILSGTPAWMKERGGASQNTKRATLLDLTLVPYQSATGRNFVRICRGEVHLADMEEREVGPWLAARATHQRHTAATSSRERVLLNRDGRDAEELG